uniref:DUF7515 domain-containing protein n=1 Tax=Meloidogyne enterolobii TaxID=390850 RepID=A0A6V7WYG7_MELEN|nr:unnamed protein product [Meloidogyne enterolobii]
MSDTSQELHDFAKKVHQTLGSKYEGYRLADLKFDIHDDFNINADDKANQLGYSTFKELIESVAFENFVIIQQDLGSLDNAKIYKARPDDKYKLIYEQQKQWNRHKENEQARILRKYAHCMASSNNNNAPPQPLNRGRYVHPRHGNKFGNYLNKNSHQRNPQGLGEPQGLDDYFDEDFVEENNGKEEEEEEEYQDFRGSDSGKGEDKKNDEKEEKYKQENVEITLKKARPKEFILPKSNTNQITTEKNKDEQPDISFAKNNSVNQDFSREKSRSTKQIVTTKTIWDEEEDEEEISINHNNIYVPEGKLINIDDE